MSQTDFDLLDRVVRRALVLAVRMIDEANHRDDVLEGDPKVGGHPAACASCAHIFGALQLVSAGPGTGSARPCTGDSARPPTPNPGRNLAFLIPVVFLSPSTCNRF